MNNSDNKHNPYRTARDNLYQRLSDNWHEGKFSELGAQIKDSDTITLQVLNRKCQFSRHSPDILVLPEKREIDLTHQVLILDYLSAAAPKTPARMLSLPDFPEVRGYLKPFQGRVIQRLNYTAGADKDSFIEAAESIGGQPCGENPVRYLFRFFPLFEIQLVRYDADEDFAHACNVFFSDNALSLLTIESIIVSAEKLVSILEGKAI